MIETSKALQGLFYQYTHLPLGGKKIVCPYWMNNLKRLILGPFGGKGNPGQIVEATQSAAKKGGLDLDKMNKKEILALMKRKKIGVDCSGFVFWMLDALDREKGGNGVADDIPGCRGSFLPSRANVQLLTGPQTTVEVKEIGSVQVGDLIRLNEGKHVAIIISLKKGAGGELEEIEYAHSSDKTQVLGVHLAKIKLTRPGLPLEKQNWLEKSKNGRNYGKNFYLPSEGDGLKRLKLWA